MDSIWTQTAVFPSFPALEGDLRADAAIVGGGLTGILTAWLLRQAGADVVVLEADRVGGGQTAGTTATLTAQHGLKYVQLLETLGNEAASQCARANLTAVDHLRQLIRQQDIDCDWRDCTSFLYASDAPGPLHREYDACRALGMDVFLTRNTELSFPCEALGLRRQACFHPLKLLSALSQGLRVCEHTRVLEADGHILRTARGTVTAESILFTCHFPFVNVPGYFFIRQHQERSYVLALEGILPLEHYYLGTGGSAFSLRSSGKYLLLGGGGHRTGEHPEAGRYELLRQTARRYWPDCHVAAAWSAQDCVPMDGVPYIGRLSRRHPNWFVATGFQKWGMSSSMAAAEILSSLVRGVPLSADAAVFDPRRFPVRASARQLASDTAHAVSGLTRRFLEPARVSAEAIPPGHGGIVDLDGKKVGVYRDEAGELFAVSIACPHMGCQLAWNPDEKSWDCPCHGSRFDFLGQLLDGPAQADL